MELWKGCQESMPLEVRKKTCLGEQSNGSFYTLAATSRDLFSSPKMLLQALSFPGKQQYLSGPGRPLDLEPSFGRLHPLQTRSREQHLRSMAWQTRLQCLRDEDWGSLCHSAETCLLFVARLACPHEDGVPAEMEHSSVVYAPELDGFFSGPLSPSNSIEPYSPNRRSAPLFG